MHVIAEPATTVVRIDGRFDAPQARSIGEMFALFEPLAHVVIDFRNVRDVDDAAVASLARTLGAFPDSRVTFRGLSRHLRRLLRYLGVSVDGASDRLEGLAFLAPGVDG
jgi:anti-anti-sigma regulatory factor